MQAESPPGIAQVAAPEAVEALQKTGWRIVASAWLAKRLAKPRHQTSPTQAPSKLAVGGLAALIFLLAFGVRLLHWQDMRVEILQEDSIATTLVRLYEKETRRMEEDGGVLFPSQPIDAGDARMLVHPPGYSMMLRWLYGTQPPDNHYFALRMIQVVSDALAAMLLFFIAAEFFPLTLSVLAALLAALSPHLAYYSLWLSPDSLVVLPILLGVWFFIKARKRPRLAMVIASGICFGLACWLRANPLLLAPMFAALVFFTFARGTRLRSALALSLAMLAVIAPITLRNWMVYHRFIPLTIVTGLNLVQGLAEFDKEGKFDLPPLDGDAMLKDAKWHNNPDYATNLFVPDGIERDQYRFKRGVAVIRQNPRWFAGVVFARMAYMVRYNDFRPQNNTTFTSIAPTVAPRPGFGHRIEVAQSATPIWSISPSDMVAKAERLSTEVDISLTQSGRLRLLGNGIAHEEQLSPAPIAVKENTDYILTIPVSLEQSRVDLRIRALDKRFTLQSKLAYHFSRRVKPPKDKVKAPASDEALDNANPNPSNNNEEKPMTLMQVPFASGHHREIRFVIANNGASDKTILEAGQAQLFEIGATPYQWTQGPRSVVVGLQKNIFKTATMRVLIVVGIVLLLFAKRRKTLLILLAVPVYFLVTHAAFSVEQRYILALHYFLFVIAATTLYVAGVMLTEGALRWLKVMRGAKDNYTTAELG
ncbi:MAG: glycosyltransferase family 39 protein [Acidobacteria bacterium]|nr:glycosyltransferase family 39 protein [Acidobacteriota bacterium]